MIVAEFSLIPMGSGTSAGRYIKAVCDLLRESGARFVPGPMSTSVEADTMEEIFRLVERSNELLVKMGVQRIITSVKIDYRLDKEISIESKLRAFS